MARYLEIKLKKEQVASNECAYQGSINFIRLTGKSITTTAYEIFLFLSDSIKLGTACSSDVYNIQRTKAEVFVMTVYAIHVISWTS